MVAWAFANHVALPKVLNFDLELRVPLLPDSVFLNPDIFIFVDIVIDRWVPLLLPFLDPFIDLVLEPIFNNHKDKAPDDTEHQQVDNIRQVVLDIHWVQVYLPPEVAGFAEVCHSVSIRLEEN